MSPANFSDTNLRVVEQLCDWLQDKKYVWLCTVIHTWGSAPRLPGSLMACNDDGTITGTLSGGCIEEDLIEQLLAGKIASDSATYKIYGETEADIERFKLPCGGTLGILIEPISAESITDFSKIANTLRDRRNITRRVSWDETGKQTRHKVKPAKHQTLELELSTDSKPVDLIQTYGTDLHLIITGVCEVARSLAELALASGYRVTICDPRPDHVKQWSISHTQLIQEFPDDAMHKMTIDSNTAIVAVSHDPRIDDMALMEALLTPAFYVGAMGSKRNSEKRRQRLHELDIPNDRISRLHAPIGLDIGSKTPIEIAIAIMAELISENAKKR